MDCLFFVFVLAAELSASGRTTTRGRKSCANVQNPERYLLNPQNPYCAKTVTKSNHLLVNTFLVSSHKSYTVYFIELATETKTRLFLYIFHICASSMWALR